MAHCSLRGADDQVEVMKIANGNGYAYDGNATAVVRASSQIRRSRICPHLIGSLLVGVVCCIAGAVPVRAAHFALVLAERRLGQRGQLFSTPFPF